jgi:hypothetical protein
MSIKSMIINQAFGGVRDPFKNVIEYAGTPDNVVEISSTAPYGKGTLCYDKTNGVVYYKTDTDSTDWTLID